jgi:hypothetical protein
MHPHSTPTSLDSLSKTSSLLVAGLVLAVSFFLTPSATAQTEVTGAIEGRVTSSQTNEPVVAAIVQIINLETEVQTATKTDANGHFVRNQLQPGRYRVVVKAQNFKDYESDKVQRVDITLTNKTFPLPISLEPLTVAAAPPATTPTQPSQPGVTPSPAPSTTPATTTAAPPELAEETDIRNEINTTDGRRGGSYRGKEVATLPLGGTTLTRTFDELVLLLPGVAPPPQTQGSVAGPGVGAGVGSAGQFAVNGLRSRANNFTVDGSDNNDEDIGVRRQGFFALVPQPIESIQELRVINLLAPAQYGRNFGAQVNAVSKSGGNQYHGTIYGFLNSSQLNARDAFDTTSGNKTTPLQGRTSAGQLRDVYIDGQRAFVTNSAGKKDSFTLGQGGLVLGGPLVPSDPARPDAASLFFFLSAEGHVLNATKEQSFAVPTVGQRGIFNTGATGLFTVGGAPVFPTRVMGDAIFSLFPFPNNPQGVYGENTLTQVLPNSAQSKIFSGKVNANFNAFGNAQEFVARYNFTQDWRDIPVTGGAIFSTVRPRVRTQNFSTFLTTEISNSTSNVLRLSYGRTRLIFEEVRDRSLLPSQQSPNTPFLLNRPRLLNDTLPGAFNFCPGGNTVCYETAGTTEQGDFFDIGTGPLGQVLISGYSPVGVDVLSFPQRRINNTYQLADTVSVRRGRHNFAFGADTRRTELNSDLPRNARPLAIFGGTPQLPGAIFALSPTDLAAAGSPTGFFTTLARGDSTIHLRYYQLNFFGQDELRVRPNLSMSFGVRYEYNTVPHESNSRIERTFNAAELSLLPDLRTFIAGRSRIYEADRNNIAPRIGIAYSRNSGGRQTVIRAGYGLYYDQILGSVISQSRNVYPTFLTLNTAGGAFQGNPVRDFLLFNPTFSISNTFCSTLNGICYVVPGSLNTLNAPFTSVVTFNRDNRVGGFGLTLPERNLRTPMAHQYSVSVEQQISNNLVFSAAYVGTLGRNLLRLTTPNLGPNVILVPTSAVAGGNSGAEPVISGTVLAPGGGARRPFPTAGSVNIFRSNGRSRYDALQVQARGRFGFMKTSSQFQASYTFSNVKDDVSDVFDLAGASALPQNSLTFAGEYAPSNFDARHRIAYNYITDLWRFKGRAAQAILGNIQLASTGQFQTGQPFTVNSIYDVNLDGNITDRLNTTSGITLTGDRGQPLRLTVPAGTLLAALGQDGKVPRNSFRGDKLWLSNLAVIKRISFSEQVKLVFRTEFFNLLNRKNYGIPVRFLEAPGFGRATDTVTSGRRIQFALKLDF